VLIRFPAFDPAAAPSDRVLPVNESAAPSEKARLGRLRPLHELLEVGHGDDIPSFPSNMHL
jgi:hypothetical protein